MADQFEYGVLNGEDEVKQLSRILAQCFNSPPTEAEPYFQQPGLDARVLRLEGRVVGGLVIIPMGQWWGGQLVSMAGIGGVGIAPEQRGSGAAIALMQHTLQELRRREIPLSVLYAAVQRLYRKAGYEQAGSACDWETNPLSIQMRERLLPIQSVALDADWFSKLYSQQASRMNGTLDRAPAIWKNLLEVNEKDLVSAYGFGSTDQPQGYVVYSQESVEGDAILRIRDWALLTPAARQTFWTFLADHRSQIDKVRWKGAAIDPLTLLLPEQTVKPRFLERWMLRIVDVAQALAQRGYPSHVKAELHLEVTDDLLPNSGRFVLAVAGGRGEVAAGGRGDLKLDVQALVPLYTGLLSPTELAIAGKLKASDDALQTATLLFTGESPWMPDFF